MKKQSAVYLLVLFALATIALVVPMTTIGAQDATPTPVPTDIVAAAGSGSREITFWNGLTGSDGVTLNAMSAAFAEANPDYTVNTESMVWDVMYQRLQAAVVAGDAPDVVVMHTSEMPQFVNFGALQPVDFMLGTGENQIDPADFAETSLTATQFDGVQYGIPLDNHGWGMWVNNVLFEEAGLDPNVVPSSYEEFVDLATQLTVDVNGLNPNEEGFDRENVEQYGTTTSWERVTFLSLLYQNGGQYVDPATNTVDINSEAGIDALQKMYDLVWTYNVAPVPPFENWPAFAAGRIAMIPEGSWMRNFLVIDNPEVEYTVWPLPQLGDQPATWESAHVFYIPSTTQGEDLEAVQTYIRWLSDNNILWAESGQIPARLSSQEALDPETYPSNIIYAQAFNDFGRFDPLTPAIVEVNSALDPELIAVLNGQKTVEEGLNDAAARINEILARG